MQHVNKKKLTVAITILAVSGGLFLFSAQSELAYLGLLISTIGFGDFVWSEYKNYDKGVHSEEISEELTELRGYLMLTIGAGLVLYTILFG